MSQEQHQAVLAVADYLTGEKLETTDEGLSEALNILRVCQGCVPGEEADEGLLQAIRRKYAAIYGAAVELAKAELTRRQWKEREHFNFRLVIDPSGDTTQVAVIDCDKPTHYLYESSKAWHVGFETLAELAEAVLSAKAALVAKVEKILKPKEIFVCIEGGVVHEMVNLPENLRVTVLDYDTQGVEKERIEPSPVDGQPCVINHW